MQTIKDDTLMKKIFCILIEIFLIAAMLCFGSSRTDAKGSLSTDDTVKNILIYVKNSAGDEVLISQLKVSDMLTYLNNNYATYGKVHNFSILDNLVTPVHQEAQGFTVKEMLDYAESKSTLSNINNLGLDFSGNDSVSFWEIDGNTFDAADTYTYNSLYGVNRYNFPALYPNWDYTQQKYANQDTIWASRQEEQAMLSITAYSQRYIVSPLNGTGNYNMENYFDNQGLLDTAKSVRLMLPMTQTEFENKTPTAMNSRYGISYILFDKASEPTFGMGEVAKPTYSLIDGDVDENDAYDAGYWYFTLACSTDGTTIYYNDNSVSSYMPTAVYTQGQVIKVAKKGTTPVTFKYRAVKEGYSDAGIQTASSDQSTEEEDTPEDVDPNASVWDGISVDTSWYVGHENDTSYTISTAAQLAGLQSLVNNVNKIGAVTFEGKTITLGNNIHLNGRTWEPIGTDMNKYGKNPTAIDNSQYYSFKGNFNGNNYTVSGLSVKYEKAVAAYCGLFGKVENATISNLAVSGKAVATGPSGLGSIAGIAEQSTFDNCINKASIVDSASGAGSIAGIVGTVNNSVVRNCVNYGKVKGYSCIGGITGSIGVNTAIENCTNYGTLAASYQNCGGIVGYAASALTNCVNYGFVSGASTVGGIVGYGSASNCINYGTVTGTLGGEIGGITGNCRYLTITSCLNTGTVTGGSYYSTNGNGSECGVGGIVGYFAGTMTGCTNIGTVSGYQYLGGLAGYLPASSAASTASITDSYNCGSLALNSSAIGTIYSGGIAGLVLGGSDANYKHTISKCYDANGGAVFGGLATTANASKVYYLTGGMEIGSDPTVNRLGVDPKTATQMKASSFVTTLGIYNANGNGVSDGYFVANAGGYPALFWQQTAITFALTPAGVTVVVKNSDGTAIAANSDGTYTLVLGEAYTYDVSGAGYLSKSGSVSVTGTQMITLALDKDQIVTTGPNQIVLSWTGSPSTTQSVIWNDNSPNPEVVQYVAEGSYTDESSFSSTQQVSATAKTVGYDSAAQTYYVGTMTGLTAGTKYYYRVGSSGKWSEVAMFTTAPTTASSAGQNFSFMYMGDVQHEDQTAAEAYSAWGTLLNGAYAAHPNLAFGLMGGDMVESGSDMNDWNYLLSYASGVYSKIPMMTTIGNHESNFTGGQATFYKDILALPTNGPAGFEEQFYSYDYGSVHVTVLNSWALSNEQNLDASQKTAINYWITADLKAASKAKFRVVVLHHPAYALATDTVCAAVLANWVPLLEAGKVDLVLCGHQHVYSRSYPMLAGQIDYAKGITYLMGDAGQKFYSTADTTYQEKTIFNTTTYQIFNVSGNTLTLSTYDSAGKQLDSWSTTAKTTNLSGDVDSDGDVDMADVEAIESAVRNCDDYNSIMDINADGIIDMRDAQLDLKIHLNKAA